MTVQDFGDFPPKVEKCVAVSRACTWTQRIATTAVPIGLPRSQSIYSSRLNESTAVVCLPPDAGARHPAVDQIYLTANGGYRKGNSTLDCMFIEQVDFEGGGKSIDGTRPPSRKIGD